MKTKLVHKMSCEPGGSIDRFIRVYCDCGIAYEHPFPGPNRLVDDLVDLPCPRCHPSHPLAQRATVVDDGAN